MEENPQCRILINMLKIPQFLLSPSVVHIQFADYIVGQLNSYSPPVAPSCDAYTRPVMTTDGSYTMHALALHGAETCTSCACCLAVCV
jgi:hypothetical protein